MKYKNNKKSEQKQQILLRKYLQAHLILLASTIRELPNF